jgi:RNA polymerase sigma factor (sigma-70 family)
MPCGMSIDGSFEANYRRLAPALEKIVTRAVRAPAPVVEEACQVAWSRLVSADPPVAEGAHLSWLATTATREALRALQANRRELPLEAGCGTGLVIELPSREPGPDRVAELREQLAEIHRLPVRQQRMVWLHGAGYEYVEIAAETGDSRRTVERQLLRAKRKLRDRAA